MTFCWYVKTFPVTSLHACDLHVLELKDTLKFLLLRTCGLQDDMPYSC